MKGKGVFVPKSDFPTLMYSPSCKANSNSATNALAGSMQPMSRRYMMLAYASMASLRAIGAQTVTRPTRWPAWKMKALNPLFTLVLKEDAMKLLSDYAKRITDPVFDVCSDTKLTAGQTLTVLQMAKKVLDTEIERFEETVERRAPSGNQCPACFGMGSVEEEDGVWVCSCEAGQRLQGKTAAKPSAD